MQLIIIAETKTITGSDYKYIKEFIKENYGIRGNKLSPIPLNGKQNYHKKERIINQYIDSYPSESIVIMFIDLDSPTTNIEQKILNKDIFEYCNAKRYHLVWFNKTIENVFLGKVIKKDKEKEADDFLRKNKIKDIDICKLSVPNLFNSKPGESNIKVILDSIFQNNVDKLDQKKKKVPK